MAEAVTGRRVLGLVPARGGSVGVPGKNLRLLGGRPLLAWTAAAARAATTLDRVVLSTDDPEIARVGADLGLDVPFERPPELATSEAPTLPVVVHALAALAAHGERFDAVCLLQPTSPFRRPGLIDACVAELWSSGADAVVTVAAVPAEHHPDWVFDRAPDGALHLHNGATEPITRRQDLPPVFHRDGSVYVTRGAVVQAGSLYGRSVRGVEVAVPVVNIDTEEDLARAEWLLARGAVGESSP